jgi:hypothetical protein
MTEIFKNGSIKKRGWRGFSIILSSFLLILLFSACTSGQYSPESLNATVEQLASTGIVLTLTALSTATFIPSDTPTVTPQPTATTMLAALPTDTTTPFPIAVTYAPTWTPYGQQQATDFIDSKTDKVDKNAPLFLDNESGEEIHFIIVSPVYADYTFTGSFSLILAENTYHYRAWIGKHGPINGSFSITNGDKHVLTFYKDKIHFSTP